MPKKLMTFLWLTGVALTIGGLLALLLAPAYGFNQSWLLLPPVAGVVLLLCLLISGLIQDLVTDLIMPRMKNKRKKTVTAPDSEPNTARSDINEIAGQQDESPKTASGSAE